MTGMGATEQVQTGPARHRTVPAARAAADAARAQVIARAGGYDAFEDLGRVRLSRHFFLRNFLNSELSNYWAVPNMPEDRATLIAAGRGLATEILDPLFETFGQIEIRSGYRGPELNAFGAAHAPRQQCARNDANRAGHIWDMSDAEGRLGACVSLVIPWFADRYGAGRDWRDLAWWIHDHLPHSGLYFFPKLAAFNVGWSEAPEPWIMSYVAPKGALLGRGEVPREDAEGRRQRYMDFPPFRGIDLP